MITITLLGGPRDGEDYKIQDEIWHSGYFKIMDLLEPVRWFTGTEMPLQVLKHRVLVYKRQKWNPGWACIDPWFGLMEACMPIHKWAFEGYHW